MTSTISSLLFLKLKGGNLTGNFIETGIRNKKGRRSTHSRIGMDKTARIPEMRIREEAPQKKAVKIKIRILLKFVFPRTKDPNRNPRENIYT
jgi:hypothetical protein